MLSLVRVSHHGWSGLADRIGSTLPSTPRGCNFHAKSSSISSFFTSILSSLIDSFAVEKTTPPGRVIYSRG